MAVKHSSQDEIELTPMSFELPEPSDEPGSEQQRRHRSRSLTWSTPVLTTPQQLLLTTAPKSKLSRETDPHQEIVPRRKNRKRINSEKAITEEVDVAYGRVMFLGASGVGKTSLLRGLKNEPFIQAGSSTQLADLKHIDQSWAKGKSEHEWKEVDDEDELDELAKLLAAVSARSSKAASQIISEVKSVHTLYPSHGNDQHFSEGDDHEITIKASQAKDIDDYLQLALEHAERLRPGDIRNIKPAPFLHIWDCGGQTIFLEVLPAFLTPRTMFLLLFDASKSFEETFKSIQWKDGKKVVENDVGITILHLLKSWLAMIHTHLEKKEEKGVLLDYPRVSLIGTHGDKKMSRQGESQSQSVIESLKESFHLIQSHYIVDNTKAGKGNREPNYKRIRKEIYKFATESLVVKAPLSWVLFRKIITKVSLSSVVDYSEAKAIAIACKISEEDVPKALAFFHDLGVILYYPQIKGLRDKVILNPEWFVKCLGKVLSLEGNEEYNIGVMWKLLREKGILVQSLYGAVWKNNAGGIRPESIMELMVHLHLAAEVLTKEYPDHDIRQYFVPCALKNADGELNQQFKFMMKASRLQIKFNTDFVPPGYFTRFATTIASYKVCSLNFDHGVYRNRVCFEFGFDVKYDHVILTESLDAIQIEIGRNVQDNDDIPSFSKVCQDVLVIVKASCFEVDALYHQNIFSDIPSDIVPLQSGALPIKVYSRIKMVCTSDACTSHTVRPSNTAESGNLAANHDLDVHYLKIDDLGQQELTKNARVSCERSPTFRTLSEEEQHWFSFTQRVNKQSARVSQSEMAKLSQCVKDGDTLAAYLEMLEDWDRINNDARIVNKILRLLQRFDNGGGTRSKLVKALEDSKEELLAKKLSSHFNDDEPAATPTSSHNNSIRQTDANRLMQRRGHTFSHRDKPKHDHQEALRTQSVSSGCPTVMSNLRQDNKSKKQSIVEVVEKHKIQPQSALETDGDNNKPQKKSNQAASRKENSEVDSGIPRVGPQLPVETTDSIQPAARTLTDIHLIRCSQYVNMSCEKLIAYLNVDCKHQAKSVKSAGIYSILLTWMEEEQRSREDVHDLLIALQEKDAARSLMDPNFTPSANHKHCILL